MKRRDFIAAAGAAALTGATASPREAQGAGGKFGWKMVTAWPPNFPAFGTGAVRLADEIARQSGGRLSIRVYAAGELVPAFEAFDAVSSGTVQMGHGAPAYWKGKSVAAQFFTGIPFGMTSTELNAWLFQGEGMELWRQVYEPFGLIPAIAGNTGAQMGGWFNREIRALCDLKGLKMRIPGIGGEVLQRAGAVPVNLPGAEIFTALQTGAIDATEWSGPFNDMAWGLHKAARYYYYPGWQEPSGTLECVLNREAFDALPHDLQALVTSVCRAQSDVLTAEFTARNSAALAQLRDQGRVALREFPREVLSGLKALARETLEELSARDDTVQRIYDSYREFQRTAAAWHAISETAYHDARAFR